MHHHRAEHWVILSGTARVTLDDNSFLLTENQSTFIPAGSQHMLENPGKFLWNSLKYNRDLILVKMILLELKTIMECN